MLRSAILIIGVYVMLRVAVKFTENSDEQIDYIARTIWGEARGEGEHGMQAVANVIMNRVRRGGWYGLTPKEVVLKPKQFSCWLTSDPNYNKIKKVTSVDKTFAQAMETAKRAYNGTLPDITMGATEYHARNIKPNWNYSKLAETGTIGNHVFYKSIA